IGGTGKEGNALAFRFAKAGVRVLIGSRDAAKAQTAANELNARLGELSVGAFADIILLDYVPYTPLTAGNFPWHLIFGMDGTHVTHTICAGRLLMKDRVLLTLDEQAIAARAKEAAKRVWKKVQES
ncbi:MAG TPA: NAD(P)-binding domain-containing protein, partial [Anaerolineae bacterium]